MDLHLHRVHILVVCSDIGIVTRWPCVYRQSLRLNRTLLVLNLSSNQIADEGAKSFSEVIIGKSELL